MVTLTAFFSTWYGSLILSVALSLASAAYSKHRAPSGSKRGLPDGARIKGNTQATNEDIKVVYGQYRIGANRVYIAVGGTFNFDLYFIHSLAAGENEGIVNDSSGNPYIWFHGERIHSKYAGNNIWGTPLYGYEEKKGTATQTANSIISEHTDPLHYTHYVAWKLGYDQDKYRGIPPVQYLIKGRKLYDFRTLTTAWSDNPVLALYDYWTNDQYGMGKDVSMLELTSWEDAADYCDTKGFKINAVYFSKDNVWENVNEIMDLFRGELTYWDGKYSLIFKDLNEESSALTIEDEHILQDNEGKAVISISDPGAYDMPTGTRVTYINSDDNAYVEDSFIIGEESDLLTELNVAGCTDREMAGILGTYAFERAQLNRTITGTFRDDCLILEPNDIITFNSTALNIADQAMRVLSASYIGKGFINLVLQYESIDLYDDVYNINAEAVYTTTLPDPSQAGIIENAAVSEETYNYRLRTQSRLNVTFDIPDSSWFEEVEVLISIDGDVEANYTHQFNANDNFSIDPVEEGVEYYIILRVVNIWGAKQALNQATKLSKLVVGRSDAHPDSLTGLTATSGDGSVSLRADKLNDPDIEIYEFRLGDQWSGGVFLSAKRSPNQELNSVKPGIHTFWANTKGTNGLYGSTPRDATAEVGIKKGWTALTNFDDDFTSSTSGQTFTNVEHIAYSGDDYLKCSHTAGNLTGQYISEEFDTGVTAADYLIFIDTDMVTVGAGTAWDDILLFNDNTFTIDYTTDFATVSAHGYASDVQFFVSTTGTLPAGLTAETEYYLVNSTTNTFQFSLTEGGSVIDITDNGTGTHTINQVATWGDLNIDSRNWLDIFEIEEAPAITMRIWYKALTGDSWSYVEDAQILAAVISARYFKVEINITDPAISVNGYVKEYSLELYS